MILQIPQNKIIKIKYILKDTLNNAKNKVMNNFRVKSL